MRIAFFLTWFTVALTATASLAQQVFMIDSWTLSAENGVKSDSTGALVLGDVDGETNLALRKLAVDQTGSGAKVTDANVTRNSAWNSLTPQAFNFFVELDLEEARLINRVALLPVSGNTTDFIKGYSLQTSTDNVIFSEQIVEPRNLNITVDTSFTPVVARYLRVQVKAIDRVHNVQIAEIEVYGEGFVSSATHVSDAIDFGDGGDKNLGMVRWTPVVPYGTTLTMAFRMGSTRTPAEDDDNWTDWSPASTASEGTLLELPEPNRYLQYRVAMATSVPSASPRLEALSFEFGEPLASSFSGTVTRVGTGDIDDTLAVDEAIIAVEQRFSLSLQAEAGGSGFDVLRLKLPNQGTVNSVTLNGTTVTDVTVTAVGSMIDLDFGRLLTGGNDFDIDLSIVLFDERNVFSAELVDSSLPDNPQQVGANAVRADALAIFGVGVSERVFDKGSLTVAPNPFSPNNDGRFDAVEFTYQLAKISTPRSVSLRIFDLGGRPLQELALLQKSGTHTVTWDGRDDDGNLVPPGLYLFQVDVDSGERVRFNGSVVVSY